MTSTAIRVGFPVETGSEAAADAFGVEGAGSASGERIVGAVVSDVNKSGGVLGRKLEPVYHRFDLAAAVANPAQTVAEICADYRDDRPVFAVMFNTPDAGLRSCLAKMGSPLLMTGGIASTLPAAAYAAHGGSFLYGINSITTERQAELFIESLQSRAFDATWNTTLGGPGNEATKLGVIHVDTPDTNALYAAYGRELAKYGRRFEATVTYPQNAQEALAATQSAVLRFKGEGVTHVFGASVFFLQAAERQNYRPRYAYIPGLGALGVANSPPVQLRGALTVGWAPVVDVAAPQDPGDTPAAKRCRSVMVAAVLSIDNRADLHAMYNACDGIYSLRDALTAARAVSVPALRGGFESLGSSFPTSLTFRAMLGRSRHHGVDAVRDMAFSSECECLVYTSARDRS